MKIIKIESFSRYKQVPFQHQIEGTDAIVNNEFFALFDEMGAGKSKQVIDAACILAEQRKIDTVVIVAPASCRCVWLDPEIGEIKKHSWINSSVVEYHSKFKEVWRDGKEGFDLIWVVTNYEFLRNEARLKDLLKYTPSKTLLVLDESSYIKNRTAKQTKAVMNLRKHCSRCVILNGTPISQSPLDLWSQMNVLSPKILQSTFKNFYSFRYEYCEMRTMGHGWKSFPVVTSYKRLDDLAKRVAPYVLRREKKDCLDLPDKLYTQREVALTAESWKRYQELKRDCLLTLGDGDKQLEPNAAVRIMRLAQLTSGILGFNVVLSRNNPLEDSAYYEIQDVSNEKISWCVKYLTEECTAKAVIVWTRWRRERERLFEKLRDEDSLCIVQLYGGQKKEDRDFSVNLFSTFGPGSKRIILLAQQHAGSHGLNLIAATEHIFLSNDFSLGVRLQAEDRSHRTGQKHNLTIMDVLATGPKGQPTIDHLICKALRDKKSVADLTTAEWRKELEDS